MAKQQISCSISAEGNILSCPSHIVLGSQNGKAAFYGKVDWVRKSLSDAVSRGFAEKTNSGTLPEDVKSLADSLLPEYCPQELSVSYHDGCLALEVEDNTVSFKMVRRSGTLALLFSFAVTGEQPRPEKPGFVGMVRDMLEKIAGFFGVWEFLFYAQTGGTYLLQSMLGGRGQMKQVPSQMEASAMILYAQVSFEGDSLFCRGIRGLFGVRYTELYLGTAKGTVTCMVALPKIQTGFVESSNLYLLLSFGKAMQFVIKGTFVFPYLRGMEFTVDCGVAQNAFRLEALAHVERPVALFGPFSIGDTCLMVQMGKGLEFGLYSSLYIRNIQIFGAVMLKTVGTAVEPTLLSAAISDISIPILVDNLMGEHVDGIEALDFIKILGLLTRTQGGARALSLSGAL
jgi:hypothetical protein